MKRQRSNAQLPFIKKTTLADVYRVLFIHFLCERESLPLEIASQHISPIMMHLEEIKHITRHHFDEGLLLPLSFNPYTTPLGLVCRSLWNSDMSNAASIVFSYENQSRSIRISHFDKNMLFMMSFPFDPLYKATTSAPFPENTTLYSLIK